MKKYLIYSLMLLLGFSMHSVASVPSRIAVIDVNGVLSQSTQVMALQKDQKLKSEEFQKWLNTAKADVEKQKTKDGKEKLIKKYEAEYSKRQETMQRDYTAKLQKIDSEISAVIAQEAKSKGYDVVLSKNVVLYGGVDLTGDVAKKVK